MKQTSINSNPELKNLIPGSVAVEPEVVFSFLLVPHENNTGAHVLRGHEVIFTLKNGWITSARLLASDQKSKTVELQVMERSEKESSIILEDIYGTIRLILKADSTRSHYEVTVNHPQNCYVLEPTLRSDAVRPVLN